MSDPFIDYEIEKQRAEYRQRRQQEEIRQIAKKLEETKEKEEEEKSTCIRCHKQPAKFSLCHDCIVEMSFNTYLGRYTDV